MGSGAAFVFGRPVWLDLVLLPKEPLTAAKGQRGVAFRQLGIDNKRLLRMLKEHDLERVGLADYEDGE
jgi:hypothetical protein